MVGAVIFISIYIGLVAVFSVVCGVVTMHFIKRFTPRAADTQMPAGVIGLLVAWLAFFIAVVVTNFHLLQW